MLSSNGSRWLFFLPNLQLEKLHQLQLWSIFQYMKQQSPDCPVNTSHSHCSRTNGLAPTQLCHIPAPAAIQLRISDCSTSQRTCKKESHLQPPTNTPSLFKKFFQTFFFFPLNWLLLRISPKRKKLQTARKARKPDRINLSCQTPDAAFVPDGLGGVRPEPLEDMCRCHPI